MPLSIENTKEASIHCVSSTQSVLSAAEFMAQKRIGSVIITENGIPVGILTERDVLTRVICQDLDPTNTLVSRVMTSQFCTVHKDLPMPEVAKTMIQKGFRHTPVVDKNKICGMYSIRDALGFALVGLDPSSPTYKSPAESIKFAPLRTVVQSTLAFEAAKIMSGEHIGSLIVVDNQMRPLGILTERDFLDKILGKGIPQVDTYVSKVMTSNIYCADLSTPLGEIAKSMTGKNIRHVPIVKVGVLVGVVSIRDLVKYFFGISTP